jgi:hypothetical protein
MQRNQLTPQEILPGGNTLRDRDDLFALVRDEAVDTPFAAVEGVFVDLEPAACLQETERSVKLQLSGFDISPPCSRKLRSARLYVSTQHGDTRQIL